MHNKIAEVGYKNDIVKQQQLNCYHYYVNRNLPEYLKNIITSIIPNSGAHAYGTKVVGISILKVQTLNWQTKALQIVSLNIQ